MLIHKSFKFIVNMLALFWLAWTVTIQSGANRNGALWSLTSMYTVNITKQHILCKCMKLDKAMFTWQGRRNHGGTDKETDVYWDIFIHNMKNQFRAVCCGLGWTVNKRFGPIMSNLWGPFLKFSWVKNQFTFSFENIVGSSLKSCIE